MPDVGPNRKEGFTSAALNGRVKKGALIVAIGSHEIKGLGVDVLFLKTSDFVTVRSGDS